MNTIEISKATATLAEYANQLGDEPMILMSEGKPIAALVSLENVDLETISLSANPHFAKLLEHSRAEYKNKGGISTEEMQRRLGL